MIVQMSVQVTLTLYYIFYSWVDCIYLNIYSYLNIKNIYIIFNLSDGMVDITNLKFVGVTREGSNPFLDNLSKFYFLIKI